MAPAQEGPAGCPGRRGYVTRPGGAPIVPPAAPKLAARAVEWRRARAGGGSAGGRRAGGGAGPGAGRGEDCPARPCPPLAGGEGRGPGPAARPSHSKDPN